MRIYTMPRSDWDEQNPNKQAILTLILKHQNEVERLHKLKQYYVGQHDILGENRKINWFATMRRIFRTLPVPISLAIRYHTIVMRTSPYLWMPSSRQVLMRQTEIMD